MLARHLRLKRPQDFQRIRESGQHVKGRLLSCNFLENGLPHNRFGFVVSRKVGNAVTRNRVKRRLRSMIAHQFHRLAGGWDVVIIAHPWSAQASYHELVARLNLLFEKAGLIVNKQTST